MEKIHLKIFYSNATENKCEQQGEEMSFESVVRLAKSKEFLRYINRYKSVRFYCPSFTSFARPFLTATICRLMTRGKCEWRDLEGNTLEINILELIKQFLIFLKENLTYKKVLNQINTELDTLLNNKKENNILFPLQRGLYLRCDLSYGYIAGGSIGHIAGVINNLGLFCKNNPKFITTDKIPTVRDEIETVLIKEPVTYGNVRDISGIVFNQACYDVLNKNVGNERFSFIYQRSALNAYAGIKFAIERKIPFVLEYNGSEVWIAKKWGGRELKGKEISEKIERLTFEKSDLITCVSTPLKEQLIEFGIDANKIIVNPNGVDENMYHPSVDGTIIREKYHINSEKVVIGFIGTFGAWHGAEILAKAFARVVKNEQYKTKVQLMLIGDGMKMPEVQKIIQEEKIEEYCNCVGIVPQKEGPQYLAACDILVSPQVRNPDGTPFFGSPTKLFEYMAMGKAIITSNMDQMAEIFEDNKTALLCEPGEVAELSAAICRLVDDSKLREKLGKNAREEVCNNYTWKMHTGKIIDALSGIIMGDQL